MGLKQTIAPVLEPVTLSELRDHLRIDGGMDDSELTVLGKAARLNIEHQQKRQHITATYEYALDAFPASDTIVMPVPPLITVTSISYEDLTGTTQTFAASKYQVEITGERGSITLEPNESWPDTESGRRNAVTITFTAGYGTAGSDVPESTRLAIMMLVAHWFENREPVLTGASIAEFPLHIENLINAEALKFF